MKTIKEPQKKSATTLKTKEEVQDVPVMKDIQDDQILSAHIKLKAETFVDEQGTEDQGAKTIPTRRRGRSSVKPATLVSQTTAKVVVDDQKSTEKELTDTGKDSGCVEPKPNKKELKKKKAVAPQGSAGKQVTRRSNRVTNPILKTDTNSVPETENLSKTTTVLTESTSKVPDKVEAKPVAGGERRRQSKRLNKNALVPENQDSASTEPDHSAIKNGDNLSCKSEEMRVPSLKLIKIKNPKYDPQASAKTSSRKKKRRKHIWTLALVKEGGQTLGAGNALKVPVPTEAVCKVDQLPPSDTSITKSVKRRGKRSKRVNIDTREKVTSIEKDLQHVVLEKSNSQEQAEVEPTPETPTQEMTKIDSGKVVPPLQIKKVSSPNKRKRSKPSFLIQQVSPVSDKKEDVLKDPVEAPEDKSSSLDVEPAPTTKLRQRTSNLDSPQTKSIRQKPVTTQKRKLRSSAREEEAPQAQVEVSSQASQEDSTSEVLPTNLCHLLAEAPPQMTPVNSSEVLEKDASKITHDPAQLPGEVPAQLPGEVCLQEEEKEVKPQTEEAKPLPVPSRPRKPRNNRVRKKKRVQKKVVAVSPDTTVDTAPVVDSSDLEPVQKENAQPPAIEVSQPEAKEGVLQEEMPETKQDTGLVEEELKQPPVKEEPDMQLIDSQPSAPLESQASDLKTSKESTKKLKKRRKNFIGQRPKHNRRGRDGKFALKSAKRQPFNEADDNNSELLADPASSPSSKLIGIQKKHKKKQSGLHFIGPTGSKSSQIISALMEVGQEKGSLKQEAADTPVDSGQADVSAQPGKSKFVKNIKHFIMPVVSARSSRVIKTPQRFMDDAGMSVLPRRNSPKKGSQLALPVRPVKRRDDDTDRAISPIFSMDEEDILSEAQLDVDVFSAQDLDDELDLAESLFSDRKSGQNEMKEPLLNNSSFKWHLSDDSSEEAYTLDKIPESKCDDFFLSSTMEKAPEPPLDLVDSLTKKSSPMFNKQAAHLKIYQGLKKPHLGLPKSRSTAEVEPVSKPPQPPVDLAEGLDDEVMSISLRQRDTSTEKDKSKLKIEDLDSPGVVRKVAVCVRTPNSNTITLQPSQEADLPRNDSAQLDSGKSINI